MPTTEAEHPVASTHMRAQCSEQVLFEGREGVVAVRVLLPVCVIGTPAADKANLHVHDAPEDATPRTYSSQGLITHGCVCEGCSMNCYAGVTHTHLRQLHWRRAQPTQPTSHKLTTSSTLARRVAANAFCSSCTLPKSCPCTG